VLAAAAQNADMSLLCTATRRLNSCKVVVGGDGRVGKTSLLWCLRGEVFREVEESTRGLASMLVDVRSVDAAGWQAAPEGGRGRARGDSGAASRGRRDGRAGGARFRGQA
jgi:hypothetical protein